MKLITQKVEPAQPGSAGTVADEPVATADAVGADRADGAGDADARNGAKAAAEETGTATSAALEPPVEPLPEGPPDVVAAGVICWRRGRDGMLEALLVHRPGYDDWSWPKGKPERGEGLAECAVRETAEETGAQVVLGRPLGSVRYRLSDGRVKEASYWAAQAVDHGTRTAPATEVDDMTWLPLHEAQERLTHEADAAPLATLRAFAEADALATVTTLVIRHATARPRDAWARADADRPLVASGRRQALALAALLRCWRPDPVICSPWRRCVQTMDPYAVAFGVRLRMKGGLSEAGYKRSPEKAARHTRKVLESAHGGAICTHRPVLAGVLDTVRACSPPEVAAGIPDTNPYLHPGEVLVAHVSHADGTPQVVAVERHGAK